jgi:hypothetical protein
LDNSGKHTIKSNAKIFCKIEGEWTNYLSYDDKKVWTKGSITTPSYYRNENLLPSDSMLREDLQYFIAGDEINSQASKEKLEDLQRKDRKLREISGKK